MTEEEKLYTLALTKIGYVNPEVLLRLVQEAGNGKEVFAHRNDLNAIVPDCTQRLKDMVNCDWEDALATAEREMTFCNDHGIEILCFGDNDYPQRLNDCPDAPVALYYKGNANINAKHVISIVGTRHCTSYGIDAIRRFVNSLRTLCPDVLIVSGLAYGADINAHQQALNNGYDTIGVLAHGLDTLYPQAHRDTANRMVSQGGLLTEYMSATKIDRINFISRNRIVAGMSDACIVVESASRGGSLITARIAQDYGREVFAFPGRINDKYSEGCNNLIRDNRATLLTSADDFVTAMGWQTDGILSQAKSRGIERELFPEITPDQQLIVETLQRFGDLQLNALIVKTGLPISTLNQLLFELEMSGVVRPLAGGTYHLIL
ncbi:MAG: DNA-processing protein DprA [Prevotella sp.]